MKTIRQRLQSRISLRRNSISKKEFLYSHMKLAGYYEAATLYRREANALAKDQRLDKEIYALVLGVERESAFWAHIPTCNGYYIDTGTLA